jgi:hypothetical protein
MTLPESGMDQLHIALSRICIWRKLGSPSIGAAFVRQSLRMADRSLRRTRYDAPHKLPSEMRMMWFSVVVTKSSVTVSRRRETSHGWRTGVKGA